MSDKNRSDFSRTKTTIYLCCCCCFFSIPQTIEQTQRILKAIPIHCFGKAITIPFSTMFNILLAARLSLLLPCLCCGCRSAPQICIFCIYINFSQSHTNLVASHRNLLAIDSSKLFIYFFFRMSYSSNVV